MLVRRLCAVLGSTVLTFGGLAVVAAPGFADTCSSATPFAGNAAGAVGTTNTSDYWQYESFVGTYTVTLTSGSSATNVWVWNEDCSALHCTGAGDAATPTVETCSFTVLEPTTVKIRVFNSTSTPADPYTLAVEWTTMPRLGTQCSDGVDNDGDGFRDSADTGCTGPLDTTESDAASPCPVVAGAVVCLSLTPTDPILNPVVLYGPGLDTSDLDVIGSIDLYTFRLPVGGSANIPCVVVNDINPCAALGGEYFATMFSIANPVPVPDVTIDTVITSVQLCGALLTATVNDIGVNNLPAVTIC